MATKIHMYTSREPMLHVNAYIIENASALVIVDTTLTMSDSKALKQLADSLAKPIAGIILTHGHPDHIAGTYNIAPQGDVPIYALPSVKKLMEETEAAKHQQWSGMFGNEWVPEWVYPNHLVQDGQTVTIAGIPFTVLDIGSGGDCDANSLWLMDDENKAAFIGDFIYNNNHTYMNDGSVLRWLGNLEKYAPILKAYGTYYIGHGAPCDHRAIDKQKEYFITYCAQVLKATNGTGVFTVETKRSFEQAMLAAYPEYGCQFMVALSADTVGKELVV
ncbi:MULTISPECIES: Ivy family c-type lysozyme inhibitor [Niastella]|uniref:MBL fold metallo-hydrolase n=1 Tax=Niastella soli TaxID=2821487 RepID=A0ABS3YT10_9BACT|nr:Ivy family c-type lysozyme inhibitor [Niastella soli]MBO9201022.1 MBL fold metallo-hydrolase [Niastella soli]